MNKKHKDKSNSMLCKKLSYKASQHNTAPEDKAIAGGLTSGEFSVG